MQVDVRGANVTHYKILRGYLLALMYVHTPETDIPLLSYFLSVENPIKGESSLRMSITS